MAGILTRVGDLISLHHQLGDFDEGKYVEAILKDDSGNAWTTVNLVDRGDGIYVNKTLAMPQNNVLVTYKTYKDAGKTQVSNHDAGVDIFIYDTFVPERRDDKIFGVIEMINQIGGVIEQSDMVARLDDDLITGDVDGGELVGAFETDEISGTFAT